MAKPGQDGDRAQALLAYVTRSERFCVQTAISAIFIAMDQIAFRGCIARIWFHFVERVIRNHIDEWLLTRERNIRR
jgi:hypothetical protein